MTILRSALVYMGLWGGFSGMVLGGIFGTIFAPIGGTITGAMLGGGAGIILGIFNSAIMAIIWQSIQTLGDTPQDADVSHVASLLVVACFTLLATPFALAHLLDIPDRHLYEVLLYPAILMGMAFGYVCHSFLKKHSTIRKRKMG